MEGGAMKVDDFRLLIETGNVDGIRGALASEPALANQTIRWFLNQQNESDPLHYVCDCFGQGWPINGKEGEIVEILLAYGAAIDGADSRESPLIASASVGAEKVSKVLVEAGAALEDTSIFGSRAIHWAAWIGTPSTVELLVANNANIGARCSEFGATPLFWAVHGYGPDGPKQKKDQVGAARILIQAGASADTANRHGVSALEQSKRCENRDMYELLHQYVA
jgi:ankyrin repeat protein